MSKYKVHISIEYIVEGEYDIDACYNAERKLREDFDKATSYLDIFHFTPIKLEEDDTRVDTEN